MKTKLITGTVLVILGIGLIGFAVHSKGRVDSAKSDIHSGTSLFSGNKAVEVTGEILQGEAGKHDGEIRLLFIGGIVFALIGVATLIFPTKKR